MKKTILATITASLFAATAVNAVPVYNENGVTLGLYGDAEVQIKSDMLGNDKNGNGHVNTGYLKIDDADFGFKLGYDINETMKIGGVVEFSGEGGTAELGDVYVGVIFDKIAVTAGKQVTILDDAGVGKDYAFGFDTAIDDSPYNGKQVIKVKADYGMFYAGAAYLLNGDTGFDESGNGNSIDNNTSGFDGNIGLRISGLDAAVFYGQSDSEGKSKLETKANTLIAQAIYHFESFNIGGFVSTAETKIGGTKTNDSIAYGLSGQYLLNDWDFAVGAGQVSSNLDETNSKYFDDFYKSYVNAGYAFSSNVKVFAEAGFSDQKYLDSAKNEQDAEIGLAAGIKVEF